MHSVKKRGLSISKRNLEIMMYFIGIIVNCTTLAEIQEILYDGAIMFLSKFQTKLLQDHSERLMRKINSFDTAVMITGHADGNKKNSSGVQTGHESVNRLTEEEYLTQSVQSPFKSWSNNIVSSAHDVVNNDIPGDSTQSHVLRNKRCVPDFVALLLKQYMPTLPLWSNLLLGDICRHSKEYIKFTTKLPVSKSFTTVTDVAIKQLV